MIDEKMFMEFMTALEDTGAEHVSFDDLRKFVDDFPKIGGWIPCSERLPEEHDSIFAKLKGTDKWSNAMFEKTSNEVNATIEFEDGKRAVKTLHTIDGRWSEGHRGVKFKVVAWQSLPEPCDLF